MKARTTRIFALVALVGSMLCWIYGGARTGFYQTYYTEKKVDLVTQIEYEEQIEAFLPGVEILVTGFGLFLLLVVAGSVMDLRAERTDAIKQ